MKQKETKIKEEIFEKVRELYNLKIKKNQFISGKTLKSTAVTLGDADIAEVLQKVDTGEFVIVSAKQVENSDGTISVVLDFKPRSKVNK